MKKFTSFFCVLLAAIVLIAGCKNGLTKEEVEKLIKESQQNQQPGSPQDPQNPGGSATVSDILEANLALVLNKKWTPDRSIAQAGGMGGYDQAGFDHEITFDKESFTFSIGMMDKGILGENETVNEDYMNLVKTGVAERVGDKLVFKNRMYIKKIYLPKLNKWLSPNGQEYNNSGNLGLTPDDPFNEYFKGMHEGYPNIVLDVELEVKGTGSGRFRNVDNLATVDKLRLVIKNGKLTLKNQKEVTESSTTPPDLNYNYLDNLFFNYYGDVGAVFGCKDWTDFAADAGSFSADPAAFRAAFNALKGTIMDTNKRNLTVDEWGYVHSGVDDVEINRIFDSSNILAVTPKENPDFDPSKPEDPATNPKYILASLPVLRQGVPQDPLNIKDANTVWTLNDDLYTAAPTLPNGPTWYAVKDFKGLNNISDEASWRILYGNVDDSTQATLTVKRTISDSAYLDTTMLTSKKYRSNSKENQNPFDYDDPTHWVLKNHNGKTKKYKESYTVTLKFDNIYDEAFKTLWDDSTITGDTFQFTYTARTETTNDKFDWAFELDDYKVMEKKDKEIKYLEFVEVIVYGKTRKKNPNGTLGAESAETKLSYTAMTGDTVLNKQTHFFLPTLLPDGSFVSKITRIEVIPKHENVNFKLDCTSNLRKKTTDPWATTVNHEARYEKDSNNSLVVKEQSFEVDPNALINTDGDNLSSMGQEHLIVTLSGLGKHSVAGCEGEDRSNTNKDIDWQGYSFVLHIGR